LYDSVLIPALSMAEQDRHKGAIDAAREEFLFLSISEMIVEFSEHQPVSSTEENSLPHPHARILCIPAHDRADEVTAAMLAQILEQNGLAALAFSVVASTPNEWIALMDPGQNDIVCISALPPYAFAPARALCQQIRERFPRLKLVVCVWGFSGDLDKAKARFERARPDRLSTSLAQAMEHVEGLLRPPPGTPQSREPDYVLLSRARIEPK
jgi:hypothetical protein